MLSLGGHKETHSSEFYDDHHKCASQLCKLDGFFLHLAEQLGKSILLLSK